ncbi:hypothetical protein TPHA_0L02050 [Tetrapisispora phaffii CBS 4417]|uniref:Zn(2)-C6 fungal-type domain-containing protein n=1 Tax=Tetrapisispora phaffii (strain ATCC 24235 / CBS 4417 / NBRC 1672 / NRRL Y-8282 / UCD 70-5) TaxID=1071381 RepID=G8C079_TETPH|nr:hypothetical protein TPHA_0L02050 [Tetrapisispora phaffii CBS 4417]CCE65557.1 hypothetical protein TPHA_0L02050 [Tetrapisispora phaffii CBS 4417]
MAPPKREKVTKKSSSNVACNNCRKSHTKCLKQENSTDISGINTGAKCRYCHLRNLVCNYSDKNQKITVSLNYVNGLQQRIKFLENQLQSNKTNFNPTNLQDRNSNTGHNGIARTNGTENGTVADEDESFECNYQIRSGRLVESQYGLNYYFIGSSSMTLFNLEIQSLISKYIYADKNKDSNYPKFNQVCFSPTNPPVLINLKDVHLPNYTEAKDILQTFIDFNCDCFYFFNEGIFRKELKHVYKLVNKSNSQSNEKAYYCNGIWLVKMLLIFGIGEMYLLGNSDESNDLKNYKFFEQSISLFDKIFSLNNIDAILTSDSNGIEAMFLYCFYLQVIDSTINSYLCLGQTVRACLLLGWHVESQSNNLNPFEMEHKRRLWWTIYIFERMFSSKAGLPLNLSDNNISTVLPSNHFFENSTVNSPNNQTELNNKNNNNFKFSSATSLTNCVKIVQINGKILSKLYHKQPTSNILPILKGILNDLLQWRSSLPLCLQFDFHVHDNNFKISRKLTNIYTEYFHGINITLRPVLFHFITIRLKDEKYGMLDVKSTGKTSHGTYINLQNYSSTILSLLNSSLRASINTIRALWSLYEQNMVSLFGFMDREYLFSAAFTLNLFNATFGVNDQTMIHIEHSLIILQKMVSLGSEPAIIRKTQLLNLMAKLDFHAIAKDLIKKFNDDAPYGTDSSEEAVNTISEDPSDSLKSSFRMENANLSNKRLIKKIKKNKDSYDSFVNLNTYLTDADESQYQDSHLSDDMAIKDERKFPPNVVHLAGTDSLSRIKSFGMLPFTNIVNESLAQGKQSDLTKSETEVMTENVHQLNPPCTYNNTDLEYLLESLNKIGYDDNKMWNEISHQANWLGDEMDPTAAPGSELNFGNIEQLINK